MQYTMKPRHFPIRTNAVLLSLATALTLSITSHAGDQPSALYGMIPTQNLEAKGGQIQELQPWHSAGEQEMDPAFLTDVMSYPAPRKMEKINEEWVFNYFPGEAQDADFSKMTFNDSEWSIVSIPHSWQNYETTRQIHPFIMNAAEEEKTYFKRSGGSIGNVSYWYYGWGYYRKRFTLKELQANERVFIEFEGVMKYCKVYFNGHYLGDHKGGFNAFYFDVTEFVEPGKENILAVAVSNRLKDKHRIPPMHSGNQTHSGGIYRDVKVVVKNDVYLPFQGSAAHEGGTFITTPYVSGKEAALHVRSWVKNDKDQEQEVELTSILISPEGKKLASQSSRQMIGSRQIMEFAQSFDRVKNPAIWTLDNPAQHKIISEVRVDGELKDTLESAFGFRTFTWDYTDNWGVLNGERIHLHGTNRTQCFPWLNNAIPDWIDVQDIRDIKYGQNHNFIRPNIHAGKPLVHDLFDQWGMLVNLSSPNIKDIDFSEEVQKQMVVEAVRRHRNRPSIVMYSVGNETNDGADSKWIHEEDPSRIITARHVHKGAGDYVTHTHKNMDMENLLRCTVRGWTHDDVFGINPKENQHTGNETFQHKQARVKGGSQRGRIDMHNGCMWMYSDDGAIRVYMNCPLKWVNPKGWVDMYRVPKYLYFLWQAHYRKEPMIFIHPHFWQEKYIGERKDIAIDSNCDVVELFANGKSLGKLDLNADNFHTGTIEGVDIEQGTLRAVGKKGGEVVETILKMAGAPHHLSLVASHEEIAAKQSSVVMVTVDARDENGTQAQAFNKPLKWSISGPGKLISPENWSTDINKDLADTGVWYITTPVSVMVRATGEEGEIKVMVESEGVKHAEISIVAIAEEVIESFIDQPELEAQGRGEVAWEEAFVKPAKSADFQIMAYLFKDIQLEEGKTYDYYFPLLKKEVLKENVFLESDPKLLDAIVEGFSKHVMKKAGLLVNDDYNFIVDMANEYLSLGAKGRSSTNSVKDILKEQGKLLEQIKK